MDHSRTKGYRTCSGYNRNHHLHCWRHLQQPVSRSSHGDAVMAVQQHCLCRVLRREMESVVGRRSLRRYDGRVVLVLRSDKRMGSVGAGILMCDKASYRGEKEINKYYSRIHTSMANKMRCPKCGSDQYYSRVKTNDFRCHKCGNVWVEKKVK